jgi:DNA-binding PadR family transcriptional regulator
MSSDLDIGSRLQLCYSTCRLKALSRRDRLLSKPTKVKADKETKSEEAVLDLFSGFIKLHVLHHASEHPVYGLWLIEELEEHGYRVSPGTLYPLLHSLEKSELLASYNELHEGKIRRYYKITLNGRRQLKKAKLKLMELMREIFTEAETRELIEMNGQSHHQ